MLSQTAEYAIRAVVYLAANADASHVTRNIAEATRVPPGYLAKVLQSLVRNRVVSSQRGLGGGFKLARAASAISVLDVLEATDNPLQRIKECPLGLGQHVNLCLVHRFVDEAIAELQQRFRDVTIADLLPTSDGAKPLCAVGGERTKPKSRRTRRSKSTAKTGKKR